MKTDNFKDKLFDLLNETNTLLISDINSDDKNNIFQITLENNDIYELKINKVNDNN